MTEATVEAIGIGAVVVLVLAAFGIVLMMADTHRRRR